MEIPVDGRGGEYYKAPWNRKSWRGGGEFLKTGKQPSMGGMDIF